eukprot:m51a1_g3886 putative dna ligase iv (84) ;mRNA; r:56230-56481
MDDGGDAPRAAAPAVQAGDVGATSFDRAVPFSALCQLFERCARESSGQRKKRLLQKFFSHYHDDNFFPLMRLLLPQASAPCIN